MAAATRAPNALDGRGLLRLTVSSSEEGPSAGAARRLVGLVVLPGGAAASVFVVGDFRQRSFARGKSALDPG
ncbi:hypothetical protein B4N89_42530 [Embleya scabrispora]|uniref:Uncharacterized protein n=1 Tax=Embleya scabrispora TaxID=159449 RepID=A0A1T3NKI8_9ACTN|nr:hypothetical protein B4N89_42530 [Embleya scabrispora]